MIVEPNGHKSDSKVATFGSLLSFLATCRGYYAAQLPADTLA